MEKVSDFIKEHIMKCYELMKDYVYDDEAEDEDTHCKLCIEIQKQKLVVPESLFAKIENFVNNELSALYSNDDIFEELGTENYIQHEDGTFEVKDEAVDKLLVLHFKKIDKVNKKLDAFAIKEIRPYLVDEN